MEGAAIDSIADSGADYVETADVERLTPDLVGEVVEDADKIDGDTSYVRYEARSLHRSTARTGDGISRAFDSATSSTPRGPGPVAVLTGL